MDKSSLYESGKRERFIGDLDSIIEAIYRIIIEMKRERVGGSVCHTSSRLMY